ncbi:hypothetical protein EJ04DRAFT_527952 [Polyplosphaeria fusca]|uniref:Uncharacterized protein n=1 Tax=Polyplosphaeria fusca TaxID=682080 RepID=A0A9P4QQY7_9PLEO|nr:hypothetical protein EJ04DRAFT_527952 [Polyplosphaeria fusca]
MSADPGILAYLVEQQGRAVKIRQAQSMRWRTVKKLDNHRLCFFDLSLELRTMIYDYFFANMRPAYNRYLPETSIVFTREDRIWPDLPNLTRVCRTLMGETWRYLYTPDAKFYIRFIDWDIEPFFAFCSTLRQVCGVVVTADRIVRVQRHPDYLNREDAMRQLSTWIAKHWFEGFPIFDWSIEHHIWKAGKNGQKLPRIVQDDNAILCMSAVRQAAILDKLDPDAFKRAVKPFLEEFEKFDSDKRKKEKTSCVVNLTICMIAYLGTVAVDEVKPETSEDLISYKSPNLLVRFADKMKEEAEMMLKRLFLTSYDTWSRRENELATVPDVEESEC